MNVIRDSLNNRKKNARGRNQISSRGRFNSLPVYQRIRSAITQNNVDTSTRPLNDNDSSNSFGSRSDPSSNNLTAYDLKARSVIFNERGSDNNTENLSSVIRTSGDFITGRRVSNLLGSEEFESVKNESITLSNRCKGGAYTKLFIPQRDGSAGAQSIDFSQRNDLPLSSMFPTIVRNRFPDDNDSMQDQALANIEEKSKPFKVCFDKVSFSSTIPEGIRTFNLDVCEQRESTFGKAEIQRHISNNDASGFSKHNFHRVPRIIQSSTAYPKPFIPQRDNTAEGQSFIDSSQENNVSVSSIFPTAMRNRFTNDDDSMQYEILSKNEEKSKSFKVCFDKVSFPSTLPGGKYTFNLDSNEQEESKFGTPKFQRHISNNVATNFSKDNFHRVPRIIQLSNQSKRTSVSRNDSSNRFVDILHLGNHVENAEYYHNMAQQKKIMNPEMCNSSLNPTIFEQQLGIPEEFRSSRFSVNNTPSKFYETGTFRTPERDKQIQHLSCSPAREINFTPKSIIKTEFISPTGSPIESKRRRIIENPTDESQYRNHMTSPISVYSEDGPELKSELLKTPTTQKLPSPPSCIKEKFHKTPELVDRTMQELFEMKSYTGSRGEKIINNSDNSHLQTPNNSWRESKSVTPLRLRNYAKFSNHNNNSGSEITSGFLRTPTLDPFIPAFTCSSEKGVQYTPKPADKSLQALLPLRSFTDSIKRSTESSLKSSRDGMPSHLNSADRFRTPKSSDKLTTPKSSSERHRTPGSASSEQSSHNTILAVTEGRGLARGEVGIAVMDPKRPQLILCQISDVQTYMNTLSKVQIFNPVEILVPSTFAENVRPESLFSKLNDHFPHVNLTSVQRRYFNETEGMNIVQRLCLEDCSTIELIVKNKFYALSATAALIKFIEFSKSMIFSKKSLKILYENAEQVMSIDLDTSKRLELVFSTTGNGMHKSLLTVFNYCNTLSGRRFLRANILQPPSNIKVIDERLKCVQELVQEPMLITNLKVELKNFNDVEQLLWLSMQTPTISESRSSEMEINYILLLHITLKSLPALLECLKDANSKRFCCFKQVLTDDRFKLIHEKLTDYINEDARPAKGFMPSQQQRLFAIKPEVNGLLDVARSTYSKLIDRTSEIVKTLSEEYDLPLKWQSSYSKGIHISLNTSQNKQFKLKDMPSIFIQVNRARQNLITCTTEELLILNQRMKHCLQEIQIMSNLIINELVHEIKQHIGCIYKLCEVIAELDMLVCFAVVSSSSDFVPPIFGSKLELKSSRHPILDVVSSSRPVGNDVFASAEKNFHIITGPNMGGKSVYIRQIALLQIMAQMGCFVPAEYAEFIVMDCILSRIGFDDSIEHNASTFSMEMRQINHIFQALKVNRRCLIIVDELCRGTTREEGVAIAWAICEKLAETNAFSFVTTHFQLLPTLQNTYHNVCNWHFEAEELSDERLKYTHKLLPGISTVSNYGIKLAKMIHLPESVIEDIMRLKNQLNEEYLGLMNDTHEDESAVQSDHIQVLATKIADGIVANKSKEDIINSLKGILLSPNQSYQLINNTGDGEIDNNNFNADCSPEKNKENLNTPKNENYQEIMNNSEENQVIRNEDISQEIQVNQVIRNEDIPQEIQVNQVIRNEDISKEIQVSQSNYNIKVTCVEISNENEEHNETETINTEEQLVRLQKQERFSQESESNGIEMKRDNSSNNVEMQLERMENYESEQDINHNKVFATQEENKNLTSQELFDILTTQGGLSKSSDMELN